MTDPREPVYRKMGKRYVAFASLDDGWHKFDPWHSPGLWLHTRSDGMVSQSLIATLDELPSSAVAFGAILQHKQELVDLLRDKQNLSHHDLATAVLEWIAGKTTKEPTT